MRNVLLSLAVSFCLCPSAHADTAQIAESYGKIPLAFTVNQGQTNSQVKFTTAGNGCSMFFSPTGTTFLLTRETAQSVARRAAKRAAGLPEDTTPIRENEREYESFAAKTVFVDANQNPKVVGEDRLSWNNNYFIGNDPAKWKTDVPNYGKIRLKEVYSGIDLVYYGNKNRMKYDFVVKPGEDPSKVVLRYDLGANGGNALSINGNGELVVKTPLGEIVEKTPYCYQKIDGKEAEVSIEYRKIDAATNSFGFVVGTFDSNYDLCIDPEIVYSTFIGGSNYDVSLDLAVDNSGNAYMTGYTSSSDYPISSGVYDASQNGKQDIFVTKLNSSGNSIVYSTFLGGSSYENGNGITVDGSGNTFITGSTSSSDFPVTIGTYDTSQNGGNDVFITKLNASGNSLVFSTYLGGSSGDGGSDIAIDSSGSVYITGGTSSSNFPATSGSLTYDPYGNGDAFVAKLNVSGNSLIYSKFIGGSSADRAYSIAIDSSGDAYITGFTSSSDYPVTNGAFDTNFNGNHDSFITKLNTSGTDLIFSTFLGGTSDDSGNGIALDISKNIYIVGNTTSSDYPVTNGAYDTSFNGGTDAFVLKLNADGNGLLYSTFLGGGDLDEGQGIAVDTSGNAYITGYTYVNGSPSSTNFPVTTTTFNIHESRWNDVYVSMFNSSGNDMVYSALFGGDYNDQGQKIVLDNSNSIYVTGYTLSNNYPTSSGAYDTSFNGSDMRSDAFITKLSKGESTPSLTLTSPNGGEYWTLGSTQAITWTSTEIINVKLEYSTDGGSTWTTIVSNTVANIGTYSWTVTSTTSTNCLIRISDVADTAFADTSAATFSIFEHNATAGFFVDIDLEHAKYQGPDRIDSIGGGKNVGFALYAKDWDTASGYTVTFSWNPEKVSFRAISSTNIVDDEITFNGKTFTPTPETNILGETLLTAGEQKSSGFYSCSFAVKGGGVVIEPDGLIYFAVFRTATTFVEGDTLSIRCNVTMADPNGLVKDLGKQFFHILPGIQPPSNLTVSDIPDDQGHSLKLAWTASPSETSGLVSYYRIYRSLVSTLSDSVKSISRFADIADVTAWERHAIVLVDSVAAGKTEYTDTEVFLSGIPYYYWIQAVGAGGESAKIAASAPTAVEERNSLPAAFRLGEARPNPFNPSTTIEYFLPRNTRTLLRVYNVSGQKVATLADGMISAGQHSVVWDAKGMPSGVYFYTLKADGGYAETKKALLLK